MLTYLRDVAIFAALVALIYAFVTMNMRATGEVANAPRQLPIGTLEQGKVRIYELGAACYVAVADGPWGLLIPTMACRQVACQ